MHMACGETASRSEMVISGRPSATAAARAERCCCEPLSTQGIERTTSEPERPASRGSEALRGYPTIAPPPKRQRGQARQRRPARWQVVREGRAAKIPNFRAIGVVSPVAARREATQTHRCRTLTPRRAVGGGQQSLAGGFGLRCMPHVLRHRNRHETERCVPRHERYQDTPSMS
jgi:hypothetical protein